jgi:hypothetical protein
MRPPKEKAKELVDKFIPHSSGNSNNNEAKECAIIAVDEIIELYEFHLISNPDDKRVMDTLNYFDEVKQELEKL